MIRSLAGLARGAAALLAALVLFSAQPPPLAAQYFGRNQVQYRTFDFRILQTEHFDVYYYPEAEEAARDAGRLAERWYARFSRILDHEFTERQPLILFANHPEFQQNNVVGDLGEGVQGVTEVFKQRIVMPFMHSYQDTDHLIGHELVHAFQYDISGFGRAGGGLEQAARRFQVPLWFVEGMAQYLSVGPIDPIASMVLRDGAITGQIPSIEQMTRDRRYNPYRWGHALWSYVGGRWGDAVIGQILKQTGQGVPYPEAFERILNMSLEEISEEWQTSIRRAYLPLLAERREARELARPLVTATRRGGRYNLAPSLSPDGTRFAFLSELGNLDVELYVADAESGEVIRRLVRGANLDPHYGSLRFISSSGTWSPDGRQFAFSALREGADVLVILDVDRAQVVREIRIPNVGEITNPSWSPDGRSIAFSGLRGGVSNLFLLDLQTSQSRQLTDDSLGDLQPQFSPDGSTIAFVTERGPNTNIEEMRFTGYRVALLDVATGEIRFAPGMEEGRNNVNPAWSRDGTALYFISNRTGISNIYRVNLADGALFQVTDIFTGVSGITDLSPAITTAREANRLLFTAFERNSFNVYAMTAAAELAGTPVEPVEVAAGDTAAPMPALLPPMPRPAQAEFNRVANLIADPQFGLPSAAAGDQFAVVDYRPRLGLDYLGQPTVGVGASSVGAYGRGGVYGGIAGIFSDMLGRHTVFGAVQASGQLDEIGFQTVYLYRRQRWNYGALVQRVPFVYPFRRLAYDQEQDVVLDQLVFFRQFNSSLLGLAQYPISRVQRVEFSGGLRRVAVDEQVREIVAAPIRNTAGQIVGAQPFDVRERRLPGPVYNMAEASAALVYDNSLFGFTSPFAGQRYRFEVTPTYGSLKFWEGLADYRRYIWARPFTLAVRGMHFGRYGEDSEVFRQGGSIFLGYPFLIRGYGSGDMSNQCQQSGLQSNSNACELFDQMVGSRIGVVNAELRFPLIRALVLGFAPVGFPPIEGIAFADAGVTWSKGTEPVLQRGIPDRCLDAATPVALCSERGLFTSVGVGARVNLFGYFIVEVDYVNPLDRDRGWHWQLSLQPGF
ncbi:MAG: PD40 domain-containing protein [Gemmatimonadetes bacterium]|nr:PD40 domain-containing protein [Gemmatimonadota bacterium]